MVDFIEKAYAQAQERAQARPQTAAPSGPASKHRLASGAPHPASAGALALVAAPGTDHPLIRRRGPYDLVMANILAGPLIALAPDLAAIQAEGGTLILAGLMTNQADGVAAAYRREGYRLVERRDRENWPTLVLKKRVRHGFRRKQRRTLAAPTGTGEW